MHCRFLAGDAPGIPTGAMHCRTLACDAAGIPVGAMHCRMLACDAAGIPVGAMHCRMLADALVCPTVAKWRAMLGSARLKRALVADTCAAPSNASVCTRKMLPALHRHRRTRTSSASTYTRLAPNPLSMLDQPRYFDDFV